jgi:hypothetical protein
MAAQGAREPEVRIEQASPWMAWVTVTREDEDFGLHAGPGARVHHLGYRDAPLYRVHQGDASGRGWDFQPVPGGRALGPLEAFSTRVDAGYLDWFVESGDLRGVELPWVLPSGRYLLVQTDREAYPVRHWVSGDVRVSAPPGVLQLRGQPPFYSLLFGADRRYPPVIDQPLVGLAMPGYSAAFALHAVFFFSFTLPRQLQREFHLRPGLVLLIPVEGPLVLEGAGPHGREAWARTLAPRFADWCARMRED